jgi:hypothetical protein
VFAAFKFYSVPLFVLTVVLDGILTYIGMCRYGVGMEGNGLLRYLMEHVGVAPTLVASRVFSLSMMAVLVYAKCYGWILILAFVMLTFAVLPWIGVLWFVG